MGGKLGLCLVYCLIAGPAFSQQMQEMPARLDVPRRTCPGDPPGNLSSFDCSFTAGHRLEKFVGSSVTDQAMLGATFFGLVAHLRQDPSEWKRDWTGFGYRVGSRYGQNFAKGLTTFAVGSLL